LSFESIQTGTTLVGETELYEFYFPTEEYYTTQSRQVRIPAGHDLNPGSYDKIYLPLPITRDRTIGKAGESPTSMKVTMPLTSGVKNQVLVGGEGIVEVKIIRGFGDPLNSPGDFRRYWFQGDMTDLSISDSFATVTVEDYRYLLSLKKIPRVRATRQCGHSLYETGGVNGKCDLSEDAFTYTFLVTSISDGGKSLTLPSTLGSGQDDPDVEGSPGRFSMGRVWLNANPKYQSFISAHTWNGSAATIELHNPIKGLLAGSVVSLSWGCDWRESTCKSRFSNFENFQGMPELPTINPATTRIFNNDTG